MSVSGTNQKLNFTTEVFDIGGYYDAANSRWTPPAGSVTIVAAITYQNATIGSVSGARVAIRKNGTTTIAQRNEYTDAANGQVIIDVTDVANGTDYYEVQAAVEFTSPAGTVAASTAQTYFGGQSGVGVQGNPGADAAMSLASKSANYTTVLVDANKALLHPAADTTARTFTIDSNANVAYDVGTILTFINQHGAGSLTIAITSDTLRLAGAGTTGSRTLAPDGIASAVKITSTEWIISGTGLT
jgi:hypothetical protein